MVFFWGGGQGEIQGRNGRILAIFHLLAVIAHTFESMCWTDVACHDGVSFVQDPAIWASMDMVETFTIDREALDQKGGGPILAATVTSAGHMHRVHPVDATCSAHMCVHTYE